MPTDAKLGLITGVIVVLVVAVLFFQKDPAPTESTNLAQESPANVPVKAAVRAPAMLPTPRLDAAVGLKERSESRSLPSLPAPKPSSVAVAPQ